MVEIAQELIRAGAALDSQNKYGETALSIAQKYRHADFTTLLKKEMKKKRKMMKMMKKMKKKEAEAAKTG